MTGKCFVDAGGIGQDLQSRVVAVRGKRASGQAIVRDVHHGGGEPRTKGEVNPTNRANGAPRCRANSKRTGQPCQAPPVAGSRVCYHHGAGRGHKPGPSHSRWVHGLRSRQWTDMRRLVNELARETREVEALIG